MFQFKRIALARPLRPFLEEGSFNSLPGHLVIKVKAAPLHPADQFFSWGIYGHRKYPSGMGFQGYGTILLSENQHQIGREYSIDQCQFYFRSQFFVNVKRQFVMLHPENKLNECQRSSLMINPLTVLAFQRKARVQKLKRIVFTGPNTSVGKLISKMFLAQQLIPLPRGQCQVPKSQQPTLFLDCVGGPESCKIINTLPQSSLILLYGSLSFKKLEVDPSDLIFKGKRVEGFWLTQYLTSEKIRQMVATLLENFQKIAEEQQARQVCLASRFGEWLQSKPGVLSKRLSVKIDL